MIFYLSFQIVQKRHKGATPHTFFLFLPTHGACQPNNVSLIEEDNIQQTSEREQKPPQSPCYSTIKQDVVNQLLLNMAKEAFVTQGLSSPLKTI